MKPVDRESFELGQWAWRGTYSLAMGDEAAWEKLRVGMKTSGMFSDLPPDIAMVNEREVKARAFVWAQWADSGYPMIDIDEKFGAALMASETRRVSEDLQLPWARFCIRLHSRDLLRIASNKIYDRIWFSLRPSPGEDKLNFAFSVMDSESGSDQAFYADSVVSLLLGEEEPDSALSRMVDGTEDLVVRLAKLAQRLIVGALYTLQYTNNFRTTVRKIDHRIVGRNGPPTHRVATVGSTIKIDCRPWIKNYLTTGDTGDVGSSPSAQHLVRGHYKRQVIGVGRTGRKVIWIEPYWRGPEDAPIIVHPYRIGSP